MRWMIFVACMGCGSKGSVEWEKARDVYCVHALMARSPAEGGFDGAKYGIENLTDLVNETLKKDKADASARPLALHTTCDQVVGGLDRLAVELGGVQKEQYALSRDRGDTAADVGFAGDLGTRGFKQRAALRDACLAEQTKPALDAIAEMRKAVLDDIDVGIAACRKVVKDLPASSP